MILVGLSLIYLRLMRSPAVVDGRRIYVPEKFKGKVKFTAIGLDE